jgi:hypothetical protein
MKLFLALLFSIVSVTAFAGEAPVAPEPQTTVSVGCDCSPCDCSTCDCRVRRGLFGRRLFTRSVECTSNECGSTYSRSRSVTDACDNVLRLRTFSRNIYKGSTCNKCDCK